MSATPLHSTIKAVTERIIARSRATRADYLARMAEARAQGRTRGHLTCGGLAHGFCRRYGWGQSSNTYQPGLCMNRGDLGVDGGGVSI